MSTYNDRAWIKAKGLSGLAQDAHVTLALIASGGGHSVNDSPYNHDSLFGSTVAATPAGSGEAQPAAAAPDSPPRADDAPQAAEAEPAKVETASLKGGLTWGTSCHPYDAYGAKVNAEAERPAKPTLYGTNLFGQPIEPPKPAGPLAQRFLVPPFSVLDARAGYWQERKRAWLGLGIQSELGRGGNLIGHSEQASEPGLNHYRNRSEDAA